MAEPKALLEAQADNVIGVAARVKAYLSDPTCLRVLVMDAVAALVDEIHSRIRMVDRTLHMDKLRRPKYDLQDLI